MIPIPRMRPNKKDDFDGDNDDDRSAAVWGRQGDRNGFLENVCDEPQVLSLIEVNDDDSDEENNYDGDIDGSH